MTRFCFAQRIIFAARVGLLFLLVSTTAAGQVRKDCGGGISMRLTSGLVSQGSLVLADVSSTQKLPTVTSEWDGHSQALWQEGQKTSTLHALIGIDLEKPAGKYEWKLSWTGTDGKELSCSVPIVVLTGKFPTEHLKVDRQYVQPDPEQEKRAAEDQKKMRAIYDTVTPERLWDGKFRLPLKDVTTGGNFGRRRFLNGQARSPHSGVDFPAAAGTAVFASQSGKVVLAEELYYSGNTVVIDHGYGIYTMYCHLSKIGVADGEAIKAGDELGKVGATGRVTGPHLHWALTIQHARVNGMQIVARDP
jgi:murein DD-endopeptidase MepM/ murein hydrolase activator NlpD